MANAMTEKEPIMGKRIASLSPAFERPALPVLPVAPGAWCGLTADLLLSMFMDNVSLLYTSSA